MKLWLVVVGTFLGGGVVLFVGVYPCSHLEDSPFSLHLENVPGFQLFHCRLLVGTLHRCKCRTKLLTNMEISVDGEVGLGNLNDPDVAN